MSRVRGSRHHHDSRESRRPRVSAGGVLGEDSQLKIDDWLLGLYQRLVNLMSHFGVNRIPFGIGVFAAHVGVFAAEGIWFAFFVEAIGLAIASALPSGYRLLPGVGSTKTDIFFRLFFVLLFLSTLPFIGARDKSFLDTIRLFLLVSSLYVLAAKSPPPRKRKDWRAAMHRWAASWTWVPSPQTS